MAKVYGSYGLLRAGRTCEGLSTLTGAPSAHIDLEPKIKGLSSAERIHDLDLIWAQLLSAHEASFLMGCSCGAGRMEVNETEYKRVGLMSKHAYSILAVKQLDNHRFYIRYILRVYRLSDIQKKIYFAKPRIGFFIKYFFLISIFFLIKFGFFLNIY